MMTIRLPLTAAAILVIGFLSRPAEAVEVLGNGGLEESTGPRGWSLTQSVTGLPGEPVAAAEHVAFADVGYDHDMPDPEANAGLLGLYVKPFAGNQGRYQNQGLPTNIFLSQTFNTPVVGRIYTFTGHSYYQLSYSGNATTLNENSVIGDYNGDFAVNAADYVVWRDKLGQAVTLPNEDPAVTPGEVTQEDYDVWLARFGHAGHGAVTSPTETYFEIAFLDASDNVIGTPTRLDLPKNRTVDAFPTDPPNAPIPYRMDSVVSPAAPAGTAKVRVTAAATNMLSNCCTTDENGQHGQDVYFDQFTLRDNVVAGLERLAVFDGVSSGTLNLLGAPAGWTVDKTPEDNLQFSSADYAIHTGSTGMWLRSFAGGDAQILQTVPGAVVGGNYTFSGWSKWESGYIDGNPAETDNVLTFLRMEFLDATSAVIGSPLTLDLCSDDANNICTLQQNDDTWRQFSVNGVAPVGTVSVRVSAGATGMGNSGFNPQSAMFDDFSLMLGGAGGGNLLAAAIPEPASLSLSLLMTALFAAVGLRRRRLAA